ncbi:uncharacterized protein CLUP02_09101 [Colletotrichum lupini]|uniref:C2H2-type domain-containing protein n=1 Tax=Colletotrichum lupini TaxID=145971 RepID=A0A9Q8SU35_9PEZI|nr:uncharacterized protein CLUP02_09101 [Colletotrichum lupini]UQC83607.1 hypothetical protein CLUP02_09101 [Colletotrichum lupini]
MYLHTLYKATWTPPGPGYDPTERLTQQLSHLAIYEQQAPAPAPYTTPPSQQAAAHPTSGGPTAAALPAPDPVSNNPNYDLYRYGPPVWSTSNIGACLPPVDYPPQSYTHATPTSGLWQDCTTDGLQHEYNSPFIPGYSLVETIREPKYSGTRGLDSFIEPAKPLLMACPYLKHDPSRYSQRRSCRGAAFPSTHRLKEHLHRTHRQKPNCPRCRSLFKTEAEVGTHLKAQTLCNVVQGEDSVEGFDAAQEKLLKSKKRRKGVETEEDKWREIFKILFPSHRDIPDPCEYSENEHDVKSRLTLSIVYKTSLDDRSATSQASVREQDDVESIFTRDIPSPVEEEMSSKLEEAVGGRLSKRKRRKLLNVFKGFAVKMLRHSAEGDAKDKATTLASKSSQVERSFASARSAGAPEKQQRGKASGNPNEKVGGEQDEINAVKEATQTIGPPTNPVTALGYFPSVEASEPRIIPTDLQTFDLGIDSDIACWQAWDAAFANDNENSWLDDFLCTGNALQGDLAQEQDKTLGVGPINASL